MELLVQKYLENHSFQNLISDHGVYPSFSKSGYKFSLNYDQIESKESDVLAQECRGLVLSVANGKSLTPKAKMVDGKLNYKDLSPGPTEVLAYPMKRFFNHGQGSAANINWADPQLSILEKLDGTLCIVYFDKYSQEWCVATRSVPEADLPLTGSKFTFRTLFEKAVQDALEKPWDSFIKYLRPELTYSFELTTPYNRIVVRYDDCRITLLAARDNISLQEINIDSSHLLNDLLRSLRVKRYKLGNISDVINFVSSQNPLEMEGVVVRDSRFNRIKVKNAAYVAYNKARDTLGTSQRNCLELILAEKDDDVMQALPPEIVKDILQLKAGLQIVIANYDAAYKEIMSKLSSPSKKDFALALQKQNIWQAPLFSFFDKKSDNMKDFLLKNKKDGSWGDSFLDKILDLINQVKTDNLS